MSPLRFHRTRHTKSKVAATATNFDFKMRGYGALAGFSIADPDEGLNATKAQVILRDSHGRTRYTWETKLMGGDTIYEWDGYVPANETDIFRITLTGAGATAPVITVLVVV